jgi:hypothetical protein
MSIDFELDEQSIDTLNLDDQDVQVAMNLHHRSISEEQMRKYESDVAAIFEAFGLDLHTRPPGIRRDAFCVPYLMRPKAMTATPNCLRSLTPNAAVGQIAV